jgi:uncharacterized protein YjlB
LQVASVDILRGCHENWTYTLGASDFVPNNPDCPLIVYAQAVPIGGPDPAVAFEELFGANGWPPGWRNGVLAFHHFHSTSHEVLGIYSGEVRVCFGGDGGPQITLVPGDVIVVPAGVAHERIASRGQLGIVGAYPQAHNRDLCEADVDPCHFHGQRVRQVSKPQFDPVRGAQGGLVQHW